MQVNRRVSLSLVRALVSAGLCCFMTSCEGAQGTVESVAEFSVEVVNHADAAVRVQVGAAGLRFTVPLGSRIDDYSGILDLRNNETHVFRVERFGWRDSAEDNYLIGRIVSLLFYEEDADIPYAAYTYYDGECAYARANSIVGDTTLCLYDIETGSWRYDLPEGALERLFAESPYRPFYLEQDRHDNDLGRMVITFEPSAETVSGSSALPAPAAIFGLEIVNDASAPVGVQVGMGAARFRRPIGGGRRDYSGVEFLESGEKRVFELGVYGLDDGSRDNQYVGEFREIFFYTPGAEAPFVGYADGYLGCLRASLYFGRDTPCLYDEGGAGERRDSLFRELPDRPFYLERDAEDEDLGRLVITFVPGEAQPRVNKR